MLVLCCQADAALISIAQEYWDYVQPVYNYWEILKPISHYSGDNAFYLRKNPYKTQHEVVYNLSLRYTFISEHTYGSICLYDRGRILIIRDPYVYRSDLVKIPFVDLTEEDIEKMLHNEYNRISKEFFIKLWADKHTGNLSDKDRIFLENLNGWLKVNRPYSYKQCMKYFYVMLE